MLTTLVSTQALATDYLVDFTVATPSWYNMTSTQPFGVATEPTISGSAVVDNTRTDGRSFLAINWVTGSKTWMLSDINIRDSYVTFDGSGAFVKFGLIFEDFKNYVYTRDTVRIDDRAGAYTFCDVCVKVNSVSVVTGVSGVPEPGVWSLMLIGVGAVGAALRTRRRLTINAAATV